MFPILSNWIAKLHFAIYEDARKIPYPFALMQSTMQYLYAYLAKTKNVQKSEVRLICIACYGIVLKMRHGFRKTNSKGISARTLSRHTRGTFTKHDVQTMMVRIVNVITRSSLKGYQDVDFLFHMRLKMNFQTPKSAFVDILQSAKGKPSTFVQLIASYMMDILCGALYAYFVHPRVLAQAALSFAHNIENFFRSGQIEASCENSDVQTLLQMAWKCAQMREMNNSSNMHHILPGYYSEIVKYYDEKMKTFAGGSVENV